MLVIWSLNNIAVYALSRLAPPTQYESCRPESCVTIGSIVEQKRSQKVTNMIVLHDHKIIYLKARKVASTSFEIALSKFAGQRDIITPISREDEALRKSLGYAGPRNYQKPVSAILADMSGRDLRSLVKLRLPELYFNHMSAKRVKMLVDPEIWETYTKVAAVRNPWDAAVSSFFYHQKTNGLPPDTSHFDAFCQQNTRLLHANRGQYMIEGVPVVDHFLRYENFAEDIRALEDTHPGVSGLFDIFSDLNAKGSIRPKSGTSVPEMFKAAPAADALVRETCAFEISRFGYQA